ncbi:unnamed protein product [Effrenium voratum]|uniref:J domain-containing protein n=1 Tax=Effrenium voratum TaxID=2562239 RepID=A0AA36IWI7_9DINO|nr:unnamed protein product [Effrenium voratum]CAJ1422972.1 unnamed protein product [Effrenium voratum]
MARHVLLVLLGLQGLAFTSFGNGPKTAPRSRTALRADCWQVLDLEPGASRDEVKKAFRAKIRTAHPDAGGSAQQFAEVRSAYQAALAEAGTGASKSGTGSSAKPGWSIHDFFRWRRQQVQQEKAEWEQDANFQNHWWASAEQRQQQKQQAQSIDEEQQTKPQGRRAREGATWKRRPRTVEAPQPSFQEDESVQEWNTFLSQRDKPKAQAPKKMPRRKDPVITHRAIATKEGDMRVPVYRSKNGRCYYVSPLTHKEVTVPSVLS